MSYLARCRHPGCPAALTLPGSPSAWHPPPAVVVPDPPAAENSEPEPGSDLLRAMIEGEQTA